MYTLFIRRAADPNTPILIDIVDEFTILVGRVWSAVGNYTSETDDFAVSKFSQTQGKDFSKEYLRLDGSNMMTNSITFDTDNSYHVFTKTRTITTDTTSTKYLINCGLGANGTCSFELFQVEADNTNTKLSRLDIGATSINFNASGKNNTIYHTGNLGTEHITMASGKNIYLRNILYMNDGEGGGNRSTMKIFGDLDTVNNYGSELTICAGGNTYIGGGESPDTIHTFHRNYLTDATTYPLKPNETYSASSETMYITSDGSIFLIANCQTAANRQVAVFQNTGRLILPTNTDYTSYKARNIAANTSDMTAGSSALANGNIYLVYE